MSDTFSIPFSSIIEGERARNIKKYGNLEGLKTSLSTIGSIHPIVLADRTLVAGGRRYRAMKELGITELWYGSVLNPSRLGFLFKEDVPEHIWREAELDENLHRLGMDWIDECLQICRVHQLKKSEDPKWGQAQTAAMLGTSGASKSSVNLALVVGKLLIAGDKEITACTSLMEANMLRAKRKCDEGLANLHKRVAARTPKIGFPATTASFLDTFSIPTSERKVMPNAGNISVGNPPPPQQSNPSVGETKPAVVVPLSSMFVLGDNLQIPWPKVDHIVTDIPYGVDMDNFDEKLVADVRFEHDVNSNIAQMQQFLTCCFNSLNPGGFCVFWYDLDHHEKLQAWAQMAGFKVQRWPLTWIKTHACRNQAAQFNFTKSTEWAMVCRKDGNTVLRKQQPVSVISESGLAERQLYNNPFAKPFTVWKFIFDAIALPGQTILDPYCGEMSSCRAAVNCGLQPFGIEINPQHFNRGLEHMKTVYRLLHGPQTQFI